MSYDEYDEYEGDAAGTAAEITIDKDIPIPTKMQLGRRSKYPFDIMDVGDSFFVPGRDGKSFGGTVTAARKRYTDMSFEMRTVKEDGVVGVRVWRTE
jgi:hypothetical protein